MKKDLITLSIVIFTLPFVILAFIEVYNSFGWRANTYRYRDEYWDLSGNENLLWHGDDSFEAVYFSRVWSGNYKAFEIHSKDLIGQITRFPILNPHRPDNNFLWRGRVYSIYGLCDSEWIYVTFECNINWAGGSRFHIIYKSTNLDVENPLELLANYIVFYNDQNATH